MGGVKLTKDEVVRALHLLLSRLHEALAFDRYPHPDDMELANSLVSWRATLAPNPGAPHDR